MCENTRALNEWVDGWVGVMGDKTRITRALGGRVGGWVIEPG